jgi:uncharacterized protein YhfF
MDELSKRFLEKYLSSMSAAERNKCQRFDAYHFCSDEVSANNCAMLVINGEKRATASLLWAYEAEKEPLPEIGQLSVITNWKKIPQCIIETTSVKICPWNEVGPEFAFEEGEGDKSLNYWQTEHWKALSQECKQLGREPNEKMPLVLENFKVIY